MMFSDNSKQFLLYRKNTSKRLIRNPFLRKNPTLALKSAKKIICLKLLVFSTGGTRLGFVPWEHRTSQAFGDLVPRRYLRFYCGMRNFGFSRYAERLGRSANSLI
jgi:hypothetical protein